MSSQTILEKPPLSKNRGVARQLRPLKTSSTGTELASSLANEQAIDQRALNDCHGQLP